MLRLGYKLSSEEFGPTDLVRQAVRAERAGFDFALISAHFHPWSDPTRYLAAIRQASRAGYDHVCLHQVGPDQEGFIRFYETEILARLRRLGTSPRRQLAPGQAA